MIISVLAFESFGQSGQIEGIITDQTGTKLSQVDVYFDGTNLGGASDASGRYTIENIPLGQYTLKASSIGFSTFAQRISISESHQTIDIRLSESQTELPAIIVDRETMTGSNHLSSNIPGSVHYLGPRQLDKFNYTDINRLLRNVPGINIQEEEGFGSRPNIGMRGTGVERSSKITLMEDGILAAPAPYVAPAAYYFPTVGRLSGVEVRKGSSQIKYGPYTTGGAINFLSTPIPETFSARINLLGGNYGRRQLHAAIGQSFTHGGFLLETFQNSASGFKMLDNGGPTGFHNEDYIGKFMLKTSPKATVYQSLLLKIGQATGNGEETYLGLTQADFDNTPYRRYAGSQIDNITTAQKQFALKYNIIPTKFLDISITAYHNTVTRNWYKLDAVKFNPAADPLAKSVPIANVLENPATYPNEYTLLTGTTSPNNDALTVRNNNRKYYAQGIQGIVGVSLPSKSFDHDLEIGFRYHQDEEDRYQWDNYFRMDNGNMLSTSYGTPGSQDNRVSKATATAYYAQYNLRYGRLSALPGIRYESMLLSRVNYGKTDPSRTGTAAIQSSNRVEVWLPGLGVEYAVAKGLTGFVGVHRGFAPPGATDGTDPESSVNYEFGGRLVRPVLSSQVTLFYNNYQNLLGSDLAAAGGAGTGDLFNAGHARTFGAEMQLGYIWSPFTASLSIPFNIAYTYTQGEFQSSFVAVNEDWGTVQQGDQFPYLSNHQLAFNIGLEHQLFSINVSSKYLSEMRTAPGQGDIPLNVKLNSSFIIDLSAQYKISRMVNIFATVNNLTNQVYAVARRPAGLRPGMPASFMLGVKFTL